jgi:hypothetical protein
VVRDLSSFRVARFGRMIAGRSVRLSQQGIDFGHRLCWELLVSSFYLTFVSSVFSHSRLLGLRHRSATLCSFIHFVGHKFVRMTSPLLFVD